MTDEPKTTVEETTTPAESAPAPAEKLSAAAPAASTTTPSTEYTLTGPTSATVGVAGTFTVQPNADGPSKAVKITFSDGNKGGTFSPASVSLTADVTTPVTVDYTPARNEAGTSVNISTTNDGSLTDPAAVALAVAAVDPDAPTFTATAGVESIIVANAGSAFDGGSPILDYSIHLGDTDSAAAADLIDMSESAGTTTLSNLTPGKPYYVFVAAHTEVGSTISAPVMVVPVTGDTAVDGPAADLTAALATLKPLLATAPATTAAALALANAYWAVIDIAINNQTPEVINLLWAFYSQNTANVQANGAAGLDQIDQFQAIVIASVQSIFLFYITKQDGPFDQFILMRHGVNAFQLIYGVQEIVADQASA